MHCYTGYILFIAPLYKRQREKKTMPQVSPFAKCLQTVRHLLQLFSNIDLFHLGKVKDRDSHHEH